MAVRNSTITDQSDISDGLDNTSDIGAPSLRNTLSKALNTDLVTAGVAKKRNGNTLIDTWGTKVVRQGIEYIKSDGTKQILYYGYDSANAGILINRSDLATPLKSSLHTAIKPTLIQFNNSLFFFNNQDDFIYNGTTTHQIGIDGPTSYTPAFNAAAVGGHLNVSSSYIYAYTFFNSVTGAESTPSLFSNPMITGVADTKLTVDLTIPASVPNADTLIVYRSVGGGTFLQFESEEALAPHLGTTYSYVSTLADINLGDLLELDNNRPPGLNFATKTDNRIFGVNSVNPNRVVYSKIGLSGPMPESFQALDFCDCDPSDGDTIVGLSVVGTSVLVFKNKSVGVLLRIEAQTGGAELLGSTKYIYQPLSGTITFLDNSTVVQLEKGTVWLGHDDIYYTDGNQVVSIGQRIKNTIAQINVANAWKYSSINKIDTKQFIFSVALNSDTEPTFQIVGHYHLPASISPPLYQVSSIPYKLSYTFYSYGRNRTTHPGISAGSLFEITGTNSRRVYYAGTTDGSGKITQIDSGTSDLGFGIYFDMRLAWQAGRSFAERKKYHSCYSLIIGTNTSHTLTQTLEVDGIGIVQSQSDTLLSAINWASVNWRQFTWASVAYTRTKFYPGKVGFLGRYGFSNTLADQPIAIQIVNTVFQNMGIA